MPDSDDESDRGVVIIDLAARLIAGESTYSAIATSGCVGGPSRDEGIEFRLSDDWEVSRGIECWRGTAQLRREEREKHPRIDTRQVLFGRPVLEFIAKNMVSARGLEADQAVAKVHADWLTTARDDLGGKAPRDVMLERKEFINWDLQYRQFQWSASRKCPPGLGRDTAAYKYAGFGTHEIVLYYDLMRHLLWECRERSAQEGELNRADEVLRLEKLRDEWRVSPDPARFQGEGRGRTAASIIDNERRRIPEGCTGAEAAVDPDCPCCQMMAEDLGPYFWHLDGCNMDDQFAFSFHPDRKSVV